MVLNAKQWFYFACSSPVSEHGLVIEHLFDFLLGSSSTHGVPCPKSSLHLLQQVQTARFYFLLPTLCPRGMTTIWNIIVSMSPSKEEKYPKNWLRGIKNFQINSCDEISVQLCKNSHLNYQVIHKRNKTWFVRVFRKLCTLLNFLVLFMETKKGQ